MSRTAAWAVQGSRIFELRDLRADERWVFEPWEEIIGARNALLNMIDYLVSERGYNAQQAFAICSVAVDLKISELVDVPNFVVAAFLPLDIFTA